jgi:putative ABC transport system substrate-binding protein
VDEAFMIGRVPKPPGRDGRRGHGRRWVLAALLVCAPVGAAASVEIVTLTSVEAEPYTVAFRAFQDALSRQGQQVQIKEYLLKEGAAKERILAEIRSRPPSLILAMGSTATSLAHAQLKEVPIVFCMVLNPIASGLVQSMQSSGNNLTGASLDIPVKLQFEALQSVLPSARRVGVLYNPRETEKVVAPAAKTAATLGLELVTLPVTSPEEVQEMVEALPKKKIDALWSVADSTVFASSRSVEFLLRRTLEARIPVMGLSPTFVKAGALLALSVDYKDVGLQCGEQAALVLAGQAPSSLPITVPRKVTLYINLNVARAIGLTLADRILDKAVLLK